MADQTPGSGPAPGSRAEEGLVHLQAAALELIAAARAFLDVAEGLAREPGAAAALADAVAAVVRTVAGSGTPGAAARSGPRDGRDEGAETGDEPAAVTRIRLS